MPDASLAAPCEGSDKRSALVRGPTELPCLRSWIGAAGGVSARLSSCRPAGGTAEWARARGRVVRRPRLPWRRHPEETRGARTCPDAFGRTPAEGENIRNLEGKQEEEEEEVERVKGKR
eukprot:scaffold4027_cov245-Pinguiococcus_pyrenoidosus.AAC.1